MEARKINSGTGSVGNNMNDLEFEKAKKKFKINSLVYKTYEKTDKHPSVVFGKVLDVGNDCGSIFLKLKIIYSTIPYKHKGDSYFIIPNKKRTKIVKSKEEFNYRWFVELI